MPTVVDQLNTARYTWKSYDGGMDSQPGIAPTHCQNAQYRAAETAGTFTDRYANPLSAGPNHYKAKHNPFVLFHSITDNQKYCEEHDVPLGTVVNGTYQKFGQLSHDFAPHAHAPNYAFITPDQCDDGHDTCDGTGAQPQLNQIDNFLKQAIPIIEGNPAFQPGGDGMIVIITDEGDTSNACCNEAPSPNEPATGTNGGGTINGKTYGDGLGLGGGMTGAVVIAPTFIAGGGTDRTGQYNHYSLLRTIEDIFGLPHLGFAADYPDLAGPAPFGTDVYTKASAAP